MMASDVLGFLGLVEAFSGSVLQVRVQDQGLRIQGSGFFRATLDRIVFLAG